MKKIFLAVAVFMLCVFALAACSQNAVSSASLKRRWDTVEQVLRYDAYDQSSDGSEPSIGGMTVTMKRLQSESADLFGAEGTRRDNFNGHKTTYSINVMREGVSVNIEAGALFDDAFKPVVSYKRVAAGAETYEIIGKYAKRYGYILRKNGVEETGEIKVSGAFYDNEMVFALIRACPIKESGDSFSFLFDVPSVLDNSSKTISMRFVKEAGLKTVSYQKRPYDASAAFTGDDLETSDSGYLYKYVPSNDTASEGLSICLVESDKLPLVGSTFIPVRIAQSGVVYVLYEAGYNP